MIGAVGQFKRLLPFILLGVAIGAVLHGFLPTELVTRLAGADNPLAVPIAAVAVIPLYLRVSMVVPIAVILIGKGMSVGAVVALIIGGAGASLPEVAMLKGIFRLPLLLAFLGSVLATAIAAGLLVQAVIS
ncbi:permease [Desulfofustis glycolicus]|uniref:Predicted permease n=1 Tax=Desulfofustis glycolicus DSM 9705 TaxID=1121409 RepID=A0A1M5S0G0_9BACT|nr:permease [Desulfofustis glycolicus]MCB2216288.1 permease [Desulfobulbaceae bacterium]SHH31924.1 Predicted permease [Desulfofustis glycolicus DSM 9705]